MKTFNEYFDERLKQEGIFDFFGSGLNPQQKAVYNQHKAEIDQLRQALQVPLPQAIDQFAQESGARGQLSSMWKQVPPADPNRRMVKKVPFDFSRMGQIVGGQHKRPVI